MHVLVTGAGGFVGRSLVRQLRKRGHHVTGVDVSDNTVDANDWVQIDPDRAFDADVLPVSVDAVIHLAQSPAYRKGADGEEAVLAVNIVMLSAILRWAEGAGVTQFVTASTGTVYEPFDNAMREDVHTRPTGYYGASKLAAEVLADAYRDRFKVAHMRLFFVYGPHQTGMLIARLVESVCESCEVGLPEIGEGLVFVPTYVEDVARAFVCAVEDNWSGPVNVASPEAVSFQALLETISEVAGKPLAVKRAGDAPARPIVPDLSLMKTLLPDTEFTSLSDGISATVKAYVEKSD